MTVHGRSAVSDCPWQVAANDIHSASANEIAGLASLETQPSTGVSPGVI